MRSVSPRPYSRCADLLNLNVSDFKVKAEWQGKRPIISLLHGLWSDWVEMSQKQGARETGKEGRGFA